mmetsp:Transcript_18774/g.52290  ORF Transcript_18774/g.52290 Transcript_18774/m.52290 type:complete len:309 (+) Transcript_18774:249-1175(+)
MALPKILSNVNKGPGANKIAAVVLLLCLIVFFTAREFASTEKSMFSGVYNYRYEQLKLAVQEKDDALNEALDLLDQTEKAQKLQEAALDELRRKLAQYSQEISAAQEAIRKRDVAVKLKEESDRAAASAIQSSQLCRQQAASALQQKDFQMQHINNALEQARKEMESLQGEVSVAEQRIRQKESQMDAQITEYKVSIARAKNSMAEHGGSVAYLAEKARQTQLRHAEALSHAKTERSCQPEVEKLTAEIQTLSKWKREAIHQGCRIRPALRRSLLGQEDLQPVEKTDALHNIEAEYQVGGGTGLEIDG